MINYDTLITDIESSLKELAEFMIEDLQKELSEQGHILTGRLRDSIELTGINLSKGIQEAFVSLEDYYSILDSGVKANRIPYNPGSGRKSSKYIDALINFWMLKKGLSQEEAKRAAFATARKHLREGMPTQSSWQASQNGRRLEFFSRTLDSNENYDPFEEKITLSLERITDSILDNFQKLVR